MYKHLKQNQVPFHTNQKKKKIIFQKNRIKTVLFDTENKAIPNYLENMSHHSKDNPDFN